MKTSRVMEKPLFESITALKLGKSDTLVLHTEKEPPDNIKEQLRQIAAKANWGVGAKYMLVWGQFKVGKVEVVLPSGWQKIDTAPRDGTWIIGCWFVVDTSKAVLGGHTVCLCRWYYDEFSSSWSDQKQGVFHPTHWMPLTLPKE